ncbi:MAG: hypothetical protein EOP00_27835 [Pedobacter sp.]|nr:MAG: hypothetical protein EOP00_27835 [Pedobacter sp.]
MSDKKKTATATGKQKKPATGKKHSPGVHPFNPPKGPKPPIKKTFINMGFMDAMKAIFEEKSEPKE